MPTAVTAVTPRAFLSTLSLRRATAAQKAADAYALISIHALLAESDNLKLGYGGTQAISIHALLAESDAAQADSGTIRGISIHALLAESDP